MHCTDYEKAGIYIEIQQGYTKTILPEIMGIFIIMKEPVHQVGTIVLCT
jgi:hypothetical protein